MAFIREYSAAAGDPFSFKRPKWLKKLKPLKAIGKVLKKAAPFASFIPGLGPVVGRIFDRAMAASQHIPGGPERVMQFARNYGMDYSEMEAAGDPGAPRPSKKRKTAGAGPRVKAKQKADKRAERAARPASPKKRGKAKPSAGGGGGDLFNQILGAAGAAGGAILRDIKPDTPLGAIAGAYGGRMPRGMGGGGHRRINPVNVKALRRSIRRLEGFEKIVKKVQKAYPRMRHHAPHRSGGHRQGCRCAVCRRAA